MYFGNHLLQMEEPPQTENQTVLIQEQQVMTQTGKCVNFICNTCF